MTPAIVCQHVAKRYRRSFEAPKVSSLKSFLTRDLWRRPSQQEAAAEVRWALHDVNFEVLPGQTMGVIGRNGSGKSTLLKLLARILAPDQGELMVRGRVAALIELGAGFHPELTGRENILINGVIMGLSKAQMRARIEDVIAFAEVGDVIDHPVRTYSSGMYARLGFAVAMHVDADILLVDEVLSVGDATFTAKCRQALDGMRRQGKSIIVVSHDLETISTWCDEALWLEQGRVFKKGPAPEIVAAYRTHFA